MDFIEKTNNVSNSLKDVRSRKLYCWAMRRCILLKPIYFMCIIMLLTQIHELYMAWSIYGKLYETQIFSYIILPFFIYAVTFFLPNIMYIGFVRNSKKTYGDVYILRLQKEGFSVNDFFTPWSKAKKTLQGRYGIVQLSYRCPLIMITSNSLSKEDYIRIKTWMNLK